MNDDMLTIEAALYATGRAMTLQELAELIGKAESTTKKLLEELGFVYNKREGALEVIGLPRERYVLQLRPELTPRIGKLLPGGLISKPTIETLMFIALKQPIVQSILVEQRGTHCYEHIKELVEKKFVEATPEGRSKLLKTTPLFADYFGLDSDKIKMKAQLKFKLKKILSEQAEAESTAQTTL